MLENIRLATRKSPLALKQAHIVKDYLLQKGLFKTIDVLPMSTSGDTVDSKVFKNHGGKGLFLKELENALINGEADIAVHSMKDVPAIVNNKFIVTSIMKREDPRDVFISNSYKSIEEVTTGKIGSSSPRRQAIIEHMNKSIDVVELRGNINTRIQKLKDLKLDGIILAKAGLSRMGMNHLITQYLKTEKFVPAPGQGVLCIQCLREHEYINKKINKIVDANTELCVKAERIFASKMNGNCLSPIGAYAEIKGGFMTLVGFVASIDGNKYIKNKVCGDKKNSRELSVKLANLFIALGSKRMLKC